MSEIKKHSMVTLSYDLHIDDKDGALIEKTTEDTPLQFIYGIGMMLPKFEEELSKFKSGEEFTINLRADEAYGEVNKEAIVELPKNVFLVDGKFDDELIKVGNAVPMMSSNGQRLNGIVLEIAEDTVKMDFNHPLAGEDLFFKGIVLEVRDASQEEIDAVLHPHGGCGSCGDSHHHHHGGCGDDSGCGSDGCCCG